MTELISRSLTTAAELISKGELKQSEAICRQILKVDENNPDAMCLLSCVLVRTGGEEESERLIKSAEEIAGESSAINNSMGISCMHARRIDKALNYFKKASEIDERDQESRMNMGLCLLTSGRNKEALMAFRESYSIKRSHRAMIGMACAKAELLNVDGAIDLLSMVLEEDPENAEAKTNMASALHLAGRWDEAWSYYPSRLVHYERFKKSIDALGIPLWSRGSPPLGNILVFSEQGVGDAINFGRMTSILQSKFPDREVKAFVSPQLRGLLESQGVKTTSATEGFGACCSMMDIPGLLGMSRQEIKDSFVPMRSSKICDMSSFGGLFKIGVCWAGNPAHPNDQRRSCSLEFFKEISGLKDVKLFSLQKDIRPRMWPTSPNPVDLCSGCEDMKLVNMAPHMNSWEDTAAIIAGLDLVISVDTSVMHLSASMGKETWGLISYVPDWRWGLGSEESFWYPSLRLFRQGVSDEWKDVFSAVCEQLRRKL